MGGEARARPGVDSWQPRWATIYLVSNRPGRFVCDGKLSLVWNSLADGGGDVDVEWLEVILVRILVVPHLRLAENIALQTTFNQTFLNQLIRQLGFKYRRRTRKGSFQSSPPITPGKPCSSRATVFQNCEKPLSGFSHSVWKALAPLCVQI